MNLRELAHVLGGDVAGQQVLAPGPGHSPKDRSLSVRLSPTAPDGLLVFSHCGDDWRACRDHVRARLGMAAHNPAPRSRRAQELVTNLDYDDNARRIAQAAKIWKDAVDPRGTVVEVHLKSRALVLPDDLAGSVFRFHPACPWKNEDTGKIERVPAMITVMREVIGDAFTAVQRTALTPEGKKIGRRMLGVAGGAAIKLDADANVTLGLTIGEGFETCLAARQLGFRPTWALGSVAAIAKFQVLGGIETLQLLEETDDGGASARAVRECADRWHDAGREVFLVTPRGGKGDANDVLRYWQDRRAG